MVEVSFLDLMDVRLHRAETQLKIGRRPDVGLVGLLCAGFWESTIR
jgi:hypothetical protein